MAKQSITLSDSARAALVLPLSLDGKWGRVVDGGGRRLFTVTTAEGSEADDAEIAAALTQLINAAFTPAAETAPESNAELRQAVGL